MQIYDSPPDKLPIDFSITQEFETGKRIHQLAIDLFDAVKRAPIADRIKLPTILRNNNFSIPIRVTRTHVFLELTSKSKAQSQFDSERLKNYKRLFALDNTTAAAIDLTDARMARIGALTVEATCPFRIAQDTSVCIWDFCSRKSEQDKGVHVDMLYVVGFGKRVNKYTILQEFDSLIRLTLRDWSEKN